MRALITGAAGQLGQDLAELLGDSAVLTDLHANPEQQIASLDITDEAQVLATVEQANPEVIFHCAAWTNVDGAEDNGEAATAVNVTGTANVAKAAESVGAKLVAVSTDYVFDGTKADGYGEEDATKPLGVYGRTKRDGEVAAQGLCSRTFVVRSAWLYGPKHERIEVKNFPKTMKRLAGERPELTIVSDQIGSPTFTYDLAEALLKLAETDEYGIWHIANSGTASWYDFARAILADEIERGLAVRPITSDEYPTKATRPKYSVLKTDKFANRFGALRSWQDALTDYQSNR